MDSFNMNVLLNRMIRLFKRSKSNIRPLLNKVVAVFCLITFSQTIFLHPAYALSIGEERKVGLELLYKIRKVLKLVDEPDIQQYFQTLGDEVLQVADGRYFNYRYFIVNSEEFNAFAAPSGLIFFNSGLIEATENEDELVSVLAHEIAHATSRHIASRIKKSTSVGLATIGLALAAIAIGGGAVSQALFVGSLAAGKSFQLHFSRQDEEEADRLAYEWMRKMNRDPKKMESMLKTMRRITRYRMGKTTPQYLQTHPNPEARLDYVKSLLQQDKDNLKEKYDRDQFRYLRMKYRVLAQAQDSEKFRTFLAIKIADSRASRFEVIMAKYGLSQLDRIENNYTSSQKLLNEVVDFFPDRPILLADKGVLAYESGNASEAIGLMEKARMADRHNMLATFYLAKIYLARKQLDKAEHYFNLVAAELPDYPKVYFELGRLNALGEKPGDSQYYLGKYNLYRGRLKLAEMNFKTAHTLDDTSVRFKTDAEEMLKVIKEVGKKE